MSALSFLRPFSDEPMGGPFSAGVRFLQAPTDPEDEKQKSCDISEISDRKPDDEDLFRCNCIRLSQPDDKPRVGGGE